VHNGLSDHAYVPGEQSNLVHVPPFGPVYPELQMQSVEAVLSGGESESAGQVTHCHVAENEPANRERKQRETKREKVHAHRHARENEKRGTKTGDENRVRPWTTPLHNI